MKKYFSSLSNLLFVAVLAFFIFQRVPSVLKNFQKEGSKVPSIQLPDKTGKLVNIVDEEKKVLIFWATWCVPCKIELARYKTAVEELQLPARSIFAINIGEAADKVYAHANESGYPFVVLADVEQKVTRFFEVSMTPTVVFLEANGNVNRVSSGLSVMPVLLARSFLAQSNP